MVCLGFWYLMETFYPVGTGGGVGGGYIINELLDCLISFCVAVI